MRWVVMLLLFLLTVAGLVLLLSLLVLLLLLLLDWVLKPFGCTDLVLPGAAIADVVRRSRQRREGGTLSFDTSFTRGEPTRRPQCPATACVSVCRRVTANQAPRRWIRVDWRPRCWTWSSACSASDPIPSCRASSNLARHFPTPSPQAAVYGSTMTASPPKAPSATTATTVSQDGHGNAPSARGATARDPTRRQLPVASTTASSAAPSATAAGHAAHRDDATGAALPRASRAPVAPTTLSSHDSDVDTASSASAALDGTERARARVPKPTTPPRRQPNPRTQPTTAAAAVAVHQSSSLSPSSPAATHNHNHHYTATGSAAGRGSAGAAAIGTATGSGVVGRAVPSSPTVVTVAGGGCGDSDASPVSVHGSTHPSPVVGAVRAGPRGGFNRKLWSVYDEQQ